MVVVAVMVVEVVVVVVIEKRNRRDIDDITGQKEGLTRGSCSILLPLDIE